MGMLSGLAMLVALSGGHVGLPLGMPPLAEDPVLANVAPERCLVYYSWSGVTDPDPKSKNQAEQLLAEPEVQQFVSRLGRALGTAIKKGAPATPQGQVLGAHGPKLIHIWLTHPTALFASKFDIAANGADIFGGAVVATGNEKGEVKSSLEEIEKVLSAGETPAADAHWHKLPAAGVTQPIEWGFRGSYLIVGIGTGSADAIARRLNGKPPVWLAAIKSKLVVERVSTVLYVNIKRILEGLRPPVGGPENPQFLDALGLTKVTSIATVGGLEATGCVWKTWVQTEPGASGAFSVFGRKPLKTADLTVIPKDASFAIAGRLDPARIYETATQVWKQRSPNFAQSADADIKQTEQFLGFRLKEDLLDTLGDSWCLYNSPGEGGLLFTGLTLIVPVKDPNRLRKTNDRIVELSAESGLTAGPSVKKSTFRGQRVLFLNSAGNEFFPLPFALAWCVSDTHLIVSLSPQNVRAFLSRDPAAGSLADIPAVAERLKSGSPALLTYQDTAGTLKIVYPILQLSAGAAASTLQQEGVDIDASLLPSLSSILRHVEPGVGTFSIEEDGLLYVNRQSLPVGGAVPGLAVLAGLSLVSRPVIFPAFELQAVRFQDIDRMEMRAIPVERLERLPNR